MTSQRKTVDLREEAARALCRLYGNPENIQFEGRPMWESYLQDVDVVLQVMGAYEATVPQKPAG